jgi:hypothetical protein
LDAGGLVTRPSPALTNPPMGFEQDSSRRDGVVKGVAGRRVTGFTTPGGAFGWGSAAVRDVARAAPGFPGASASGCRRSSRLAPRAVAAAGAGSGRGGPVRFAGSVRRGFAPPHPRSTSRRRTHRMLTHVEARHPRPGHRCGDGPAAVDAKSSEIKPRSSSWGADGSTDLAEARARQDVATEAGDR